MSLDVNEMAGDVLKHGQRRKPAEGGVEKPKPISRAPAQGGTEDSDVEVEGPAAGEAVLEHPTSKNRCSGNAEGQRPRKICNEAGVGHKP